MELEEAIHRLSPPYVLFAIALKSAQVSTDWRAVQDRLRDTLRGLKSQTDTNSVAVICGHEKPDLTGFEDVAVWLSVDWPVPSSPDEFSNDKTRKRSWILKSVRPYVPDGAYIFLLDADDLIAPNVVEYMRAHDNRQGYYVKSGYLWDRETGDLAKNKPARDFYQHCGSCGAVWLGQSEFPRRMSDKSQSWNKMRAHSKFVADWEAAGKILDPLPFPAMIYILNHGQNNTQIKQNAAGTLNMIASHAMSDAERSDALRTFGIGSEVSQPG